MKNVQIWGVFYVWIKFSLLRFSWEQRHILLCTFWKEFEMGLSTAFPFEFGFFRLPGKIQRVVIPPQSCICNPNLLLTDTLYYRIQVGLKREVFHMCECVLLAISPEKVWCRLLGILPKWGPRVIVWSCWRWLLVRQPPLLHHCWGVCLVLLEYTHGLSLPNRAVWKRSKL